MMLLREEHLCFLHLSLNTRYSPPQNTENEAETLLERDLSDTVYLQPVVLMMVPMRQQTLKTAPSLATSPGVQNGKLLLSLLQF